MYVTSCLSFIVGCKISYWKHDIATVGMIYCFFHLLLVSCVMTVCACDRVPRYTSTSHKQSRVISDADIIVDLQKIFSAFDTARQSQMPYTEASCDSHCLTAGKRTVGLKDESLLRYRYSKNVDAMLQSCGFTVERRPSMLKHAGTGVLVTGGTVPAGVITSLYPGMNCVCYLSLIHI